jgi:phosphohistidine phosphatase
MKTMILMRHAKSDRSDLDCEDHDRPLSKRGEADSVRMGEWLREAGFSPKVILCSTATRAKATLDLMRPALPAGVKIRLRRPLYMAVPREILAEAAKVPEDTDPLLILGHNPGLSHLASWLVGQQAGRPDARKALASLRKKFPTGAIAVIELPIESWSELDGERGILRNFVTPRQVAEGISAKNAAA